MTTHSVQDSQFAIEAKGNTLMAASLGVTIGAAMAAVADSGKGITAIWPCGRGYGIGAVLIQSGMTTGFLVSCAEEAEFYRNALPEIRRRLRKAPEWPAAGHDGAESRRES